MKQYQYVLFDWDGTIGKTLNIWSDALKVTLSRNGYSFNEAEIGANYELFRADFQHLGDQALDEIMKDALAISKQKIPSVELYECAADVLTILHKNKKLGLVTTSLHSDIDPLLKNYGLQHLFDVVVCGDDVTQQKPNAEPIIAAMKSIGAVESATIMVGDSDKDILAAQNAGVDSILFYPPEHRRFHDVQTLKSYRPTYIIKKFPEVLNIVV
jgi:pyrophosphatase PpaX